MMLIEITEEYSKEKIKYLTDLRIKTIKYLAAEQDPKKIISFLSKVGIVEIDEKNKKVFIGVSNEFILLQVKKFFGKQLDTAIRTIYSPNFDTEIFIFSAFSDKKHPLLVDIKKILGIKKTEIIESNGIDKSISQQLQDYFGILFDTKYRFDNFIVGSNNQLAYAASKAVAENPGKIYNPLFIYGDVGLGKTHLLQAIGNYIISNISESPVVYLPTSKFLDEIIQGIRKNALNKIIDKFDKVKVLILDDIQFLAGAEKTQEIFHNIFNEFLLKGKQIILSSDRPPSHLNKIADRLKSRFALGLVIDIQKPDFETRVAILQQKLNEKGEYIPYEYLITIAENITSNIRELEGALNLLITKKKFIGNGEINQQDVYDVLKTLGYDSNKKSIDTANPAEISVKKERIKFTELVKKVGEFYDIDPEELKKETRIKAISQARQILMYLAKKYYNRSLSRIGEFFGGKNHTTVLYAIKNIEKKIENDENIRYEIKKFEEIINGK